MEPPSLAPLTLKSSHPWSPTPNYTFSIPLSLLSTPTQPPPTTLLPHPKRDEPQCLWPIKTWPTGGQDYSIATITSPCTPAPWNAAGNPITPDNAMTPDVAQSLPSTTWSSPDWAKISTLSRITTTAPTCTPSTNPQILGLDRSGWLQMVILLPLMAMLLAILGFWAGWMLGRRKKEADPVVDEHHVPGGPGPEPGPGPGPGPVHQQEVPLADLPIQQPVPVHHGGADPWPVPHVPGAWPGANHLWHH